MERRQVFKVTAGKNRICSAVAESRGKIECWASVGEPDRCPAFDFSDSLKEKL
jgi:hypothetical protein